MGNGVSRLENEIRRMERERKNDWNKMWDLVAENREEINAGKRKEKMLTKILNQYKADQKAAELKYAQGALDRSEFTDAIRPGLKTRLISLENDLL